MELGGAAEQGNNRPGAEQGEHNNTGPQRRGFGEEQKLPVTCGSLVAPQYQPLVVSHISLFYSCIVVKTSLLVTKQQLTR